MWYSAFLESAYAYYVLSRGGATRRPVSESEGSGLVRLDHEKKHGEWMLCETSTSVMAAAVNRVIELQGGLESAVYHEHGINVLPLGNGARAEHTVDEHIYVEDMERIVEVIRFLFDRFSNRDLDDLATAGALGGP